MKVKTKRLHYNKTLVDKMCKRASQATKCAEDIYIYNSTNIKISLGGTQIKKTINKNGPTERMT